MAGLEVTEFEVGSHSAVALSGELTIATAPDLRDVLTRYVRKKNPVLLLDLSELTFMDTSGLATFIEALQRMEERGGRLALCGLDPLIAEVFEVTHVVELFSIFDTQEQAAAALSAPQA